MEFHLRLIEIFPGGANTGTSDDRENYVSFLKTIRAALDSHAESNYRTTPYILTIVGGAGASVIDSGYDLDGIVEVVDWINVMTYDYFGPWDSKWGKYTGPVTPLFFGAPSGYSKKLTVDYTMRHYDCAIRDPSKLVMGLPFYGRFWNDSGKI